MTDTPEAIAECLTRAQREAILGARFYEDRGAWLPSGYYALGDKRVRYRLAYLDLTNDYLRRENCLTSLGQSVRDHLKQKEPK